VRDACIVVAIVGFLCPGTSSAQQPARFATADKVAIDQLLDRYVQAYSAKEYAKLREQLQAPFVRFPAGWEVLNTLDEVMNFYRQQRDALDEQNYARSEFVQSRITALAADRALVDRTYRRYRRDGTLLLEAAAVYVVSKSSGTWKVCGLFPRELGDFGKVY
jgi:uncharacterized membrane protein YccC